MSMSSVLRKDLKRWVLQPLRHTSQEEVTQLAWQLVAIPSHSEVGDRAVAEWLRGFLKKEGLIGKIQSVTNAKHVNLVIKMPGNHEGYRLLLNGHLDTVPPPTSNAQPPEIRHGRLCGRGATDMKGGIAAMVMALVALHRARVPLQYGVLFTGVAGEEIGGLGTKAFLDAGERADMAIIGEPTQLRLVTAHKGIEWLQIKIEGYSTHASCPDAGVNAISHAAKVVQALEEWASRHLIKRKHPLLGPPTLSVGTINGGVTPATVPEDCIIQVDRRWVPGETVEQIYQEMRDVVSQALKGKTDVQFDISRMEETKHCIPVETPLSVSLVNTLGGVLVDIGLSPDPQGVPYGTDASWLSQFGIPAVVCGPGDIHQAHSNDEFINLKQIWQATMIYLEAILRLCGPISIRNGG